MKVVRIDTALVSIPLKTRYVFASHVADAFRNVLVWVETDAGHRGVGEASFSGRGGGVYPETPESAKLHIDRYLAAEVVGEDPFDIERIHEKLDHALPGNLVAKSGIDLAHWDIDGMAAVARAVGMPVSSDESNSTFDSVMRIIDRRAASILNLKISKNGGLFRCKQIAAIAEAAGVPCIVGGNTTFEIGRQA